jgi:beta-exotoxin I transport system ATP-binding protein
VETSAVSDLAARLDLDLSRHIGDLSAGNKQKVGVIGAFMHDPEILILDEPTTGLDPLRQQVVLDLIRERASAGRTVFLSSHELDQVEHAADRVGIVRDGRLIAIEAIATLKARGLRRVEVRLTHAEPEAEALASLPGVRDVVVENRTVRLTVEGAMDRLIKALSKLPVETLTSEAPDLDEIFLSYYGTRDDDE